MTQSMHPAYSAYIPNSYPPPFIFLTLRRLHPCARIHQVIAMDSARANISAVDRRSGEGAPEVCRLSDNPVRCPAGRARGHISRPQRLFLMEEAQSRSLAYGSTTRYFLATPDGVCSSHHSELLTPNYTLLRPLAGRRTIARSGASARLRDNATPTLQDPLRVARRMYIGAMGRRFVTAVCSYRRLKSAAPCKHCRATLRSSVSPCGWLSLTKIHFFTN